MFTGKTDHAYEMELAALGIFIRNAVEELKESKSRFQLMPMQAHLLVCPPSGGIAELHI